MAESDESDELEPEDVSALKEMAAWWRDSKMGRRAVLGLSAGAGTAMAAGGGFMAGKVSADASTSDGDGDVGQPGDRVDVFADGIDANVMDVEEIGSGRHYARGYDGADADARLDSAISAADNGDAIFLESATYSDDRSIPKSIMISGNLRQTDITGTWTLNNTGIILRYLQLSSDPTFGSQDILVSNCRFLANITVEFDRTRILGNLGSTRSLTFEAGVNDGIADSNQRLGVTDNGSNTVGDNS